MHWGYKIALTYTAFVGGVLFMVYKSTQHPVDLVRDDYYEQSLRYDSWRAKSENALRVAGVKIFYSRESSTLQLTFPEAFQQEGITGVITFYRHSDRRLDFTRKLETKPGESSIDIPIDGIHTGLWLVQIEWQAGGKEYYYQESIVL